MSDRVFTLSIEYSSRKHGWGYFDGIFDEIFDQMFYSAGTLISGKNAGWRDVDWFFSTKEEALEWLRVVESIMASNNLTMFKARIYPEGAEDYVWEDDRVQARRIER